MATEKAKARKAAEIRTAVGMEAAAEVEMREATTKTRLAGLGSTAAAGTIATNRFASLTSATAH